MMAGTPAAAWADPTPDPAPPPPPSANALTPVSPVAFDTMIAEWLNGPLPGAPNAANVVTGGPVGEPGFSNADRPLYGFDKPVRELAAGSRLSVGTLSCGVDGAGSIICSNSFDQTGFVIGPAGTFTFGAVNPLLDRPQGTNPYMN